LYRKVLNQQNKGIVQVKLLDVVNIELSELSPAFLSYDTDGGKFKLPKKGKYMMLILQKPCEENSLAQNLLTTL
jgi:hypothetical protein